MSSKTDRIYLRIDPKLKKKVLAYCLKKHIPLSTLVTMYLAELIETDKPGKP